MRTLTTAGRSSWTPLDVLGLELLFVASRVSPLQSLGGYVIRGYNLPAEQTGRARLKVVDAAANLRYPTAPVGFEPDSHVEIRHAVERGKSVEQASPFSAIHAADHHVAFRNEFHDSRIDDV